MGKDTAFGQLAIQQKFATKHQLQKCFQIRKKLLSMGVQPKPLGDIMMEKGIITSQQKQRILDLMAQEDNKVEIEGYEIMGLLGEGGMGSVYKARQLSMERIVALKVLPLHYAQNPEYVQKFKAEARIVAKLNHENIVSGIDIGQNRGFHYFAMEFVDGQSLNFILEKDNSLPEDESVDIAVQVARAIEHFFKQNIVHCDIKPHNIMIDKAKNAKLCDLGLARPLGANAAPKAQAVGTPHYVSPEQAKGTEDVDIRGDIYSLGATLYHLVVGEPPFSGSNPMVVMTKHLTEPVVPPIKKKPTISPALNSVIMKMLAKRKEDRYNTPTELLEDLLHIQEGKGFDLPHASAAAVPAAATARKAARGGSSRGVVSRRGGGGRKRGGTRSAAKARALAQRNKHETASLIIFIFLAVFVFASVTYVVMFSKPTIGEPIKKIDSDRAWELLDAAATYQGDNKDDVSGIIQRYQRVVDEYEGSEAAQQAEQRIRALENR